MKNSNLNEKKWIIVVLLHHIKRSHKMSDNMSDRMSNRMSDKTIYYQRKRETILNRTKEYYKNNKEILREKVRNEYRELSEKEKDIKREYVRNTYYNTSKEKKTKTNIIPRRLSWFKKVLI